MDWTSRLAVYNCVGCVLLYSQGTAFPVESPWPLAILASSVFLGRGEMTETL